MDVRDAGMDGLDGDEADDGAGARAEGAPSAPPDSDASLPQPRPESGDQGVNPKEAPHQTLVARDREVALAKATSTRVMPAFLAARKGRHADDAGERGRPPALADGMATADFAQRYSISQETVKSRQAQSDKLKPTRARMRSRSR